MSSANQLNHSYPFWSWSWRSQQHEWWAVLSNASPTEAWCLHPSGGCLLFNSTAWHSLIQLALAVPDVDGPALPVKPAPCLTTATWRCRNNSSQWQQSFQWKLSSHWLKFLRQHHFAEVRQGPGSPAVYLAGPRPQLQCKGPWWPADSRLGYHFPSQEQDPLLVYGKCQVSDVSIWCH